MSVAYNCNETHEVVDQATDEIVANEVTLLLKSDVVVYWYSTLVKESADHKVSANQAVGMGLN